MQENDMVSAPVGGGVQNETTTETGVPPGMVAEQPKKKSKTGLIIGLIVGGIVLIGGITAIVLITMLGNKPNYEDGQNILSKMVDQRSTWEEGIDIGAITSGAADEEDINDAESSIAKIQSSVAELKALTQELERSSVLKDEAIKAKYDDFMATSNTVMPKLEKYAATAETLVEFLQEFYAADLETVLSGEDMDKVDAMTEETIRELFAPLKTTGVERLTGFAEASEEIYIKMLNFFKEYGRALTGEEELSEEKMLEATAASEEIVELTEEYAEEWMGDGLGLTGEGALGITRAEIDEYFEKLDALYAEIESKIK